MARGKTLVLQDAISIIKVDPKRLEELYDKKTMLEQQVDLMEGDRRSLVEEAFHNKKEIINLKLQLDTLHNENLRLSGKHYTLGLRIRNRDLIIGGLAGAILALMIFQIYMLS